MSICSRNLEKITLNNLNIGILYSKNQRYQHNMRDPFPITTDTLPKDMTSEAKLTMGRVIDTLNTEFPLLFEKQTLDMSIYSPNLIFKLITTLTPITLHGSIAYEKFLYFSRYCLSMYYDEAKVSLLPTPAHFSRSNLLSDSGILCVHWKLTLCRKHFLLRYFPRSWIHFYRNHISRYFKSIIHGDSSTKILHKDQNDSSWISPTVFQGLSYFTFNQQGLVSKHVIDQIVPPPPKFLAWFLFPWRFFRAPAASVTFTSK